MSEPPSSQQHRSQQPDANIFVGPGNTSLGVGPVIPDSMPPVQSGTQSGNNTSQQQGETHNPFVGPGGVHLGHGPRVDHLPKNADGTFRLGGEKPPTQGGERQEGSNGQESQSGSANPWRGPGGMKLGHGPRVDHLPKNEDGTFRLGGSQQDGQGSSGGQCG